MFLGHFSVRTGTIDIYFFAFSIFDLACRMVKLWNHTFRMSRQCLTACGGRGGSHAGSLAINLSSADLEFPQRSARSTSHKQELKTN